MTNFENVVRAILQFNTNRNAALDEAMDEILTKFHADVGTLHLLDRERNLLVMAAAKGIPEAVLEHTREIPIGKGIAGEAAETRQPVTTCNLQTEEGGPAKPRAKETGLAGTICVPLLDRQGEVVGTLGIGTREAHDYSEQETEDLMRLGRVMAVDLGPTVAAREPEAHEG